VTGKKRAPAATGAGAAALAANLAASTTGNDSIAYLADLCQPWPACVLDPLVGGGRLCLSPLGPAPRIPPPPKVPGWHLGDLAEQAAIKMALAGLLADAYQAAGDLEAWALWRRRELQHQAIAWAATHPPQRGEK